VQNTGIRENDPSLADPNLRNLVSLAGILIVMVFPFVNFPGLAIISTRLFDHPWFPAPLQSAALKSALAATLACFAFVICGRKPASFGMHRVLKEDVFAMLKVWITLFAVVIVLKDLQAYFFAPRQPGGEGTPGQTPLLWGLADAITAGVTEEFLYRGYLIEELGELLTSRTLAAAGSILAFTFAHVSAGYGWSIDLMYPGMYGLALTILYLWRRNLWICIFMHAGLDVIYTLLH
jgi:membrane protease YdiL (CAAX protease family)